jgi:hypothetical protein
MDRELRGGIAISFDRRSNTMMKASDYDLSRSEWTHLIDEWIFKERDRAIVKRRILDGIHYERLAEEFDLSVQQTKEIVYKANEILIKHV